MKMPKKISPSPIAEALVELRFFPSIPYDAVFGVVYNVFKERYGKPESLPILQLPEALRAGDPNLIYKPTHRFSNDNFILQVGPKVICFSNIKEYVGWESFNEKVLNLFERIFNLNFIKSFELLFLRYIDVFEGNIYDNLNLQINIKGAPFISLTKNFVAEIQENNYIHKLQITDKAEIEMGEKKVIGSVIDIQTQLSLKDIDFHVKYKDMLDDIHLKGKNLFFSLLKDEFIASLNPEY